MKEYLKTHLWTLAIPFILLASVFQYTFDLGEQGKLENTFLRESIYPTAKIVNGTMTNVKFRLRGTQPVKHKVVIVEADDGSIEKLGRWPWHREVYAHLVHTIFKHGAKVVGLDVTFSEPENRIPQEVYEITKQSAPQIEEQLRSFEGDPILAEVIKTYQKRVVLGHASNVGVQPRYSSGDELEAVKSPDYSAQIPELAGKFAMADPIPLPLEKIYQSPLMYMLSMIANIPALRDAALHAGLFNVEPDPDGYIRRYPLFFINKQLVYPTLALKMAELINEDTAKVKFTEDGRVDQLSFLKSPDSPIPVTKLGYIDLNFRGPSRSFKYIPAFDVLEAAENPDRKDVTEALKDAYVLFGASALGIYDMRAFPFDHNTPGVEGHATALDNLLAKDYLKSATAIKMEWLPMALLIGIGLLLAGLFSRLEALPSAVIFLVFAVAFGAIDVKLLFQNNINIPTAFLFLEMVLIFMVVLAVRYWLEEEDKKHIRDAFSHYLAPQVVDMVLDDPSRLTVGGERKDMTILFSDLRGFTTISEGMDPKTLAQFLNEYLSEMTDIVFENKGTLDKYIGDAIMAFWGAPLKQEDHAALATRAAVQMIEKLKKIAPDFKKRYNVDVGMGIGINSGVVSVGNMGSKKIFEYTVIGDHVNLASRLEGLNRLYGTDILTSKNTIEALTDAQRSALSYRVIDSVKVKGKKQAVDLYHISDFKLDPQIIDLFYQGREAFKNRQWEQAIEKFKAASDLHQKNHGVPDPVSETFIERVEDFKLNPPDEGWDGTIEMRTK